MEVNRNCGGQKKVCKTKKPIREDFSSHFKSGLLFDCKRPSGRLGVVALFNCSATQALIQPLWKSHQNNTSNASSPHNLASKEQLNITDGFWVQVQWTDEVSREVWLKRAVWRGKGAEHLSRILQPVIHVTSPWIRSLGVRKSCELINNLKILEANITPSKEWPLRLTHHKIQDELS